MLGRVVVELVVDEEIALDAIDGAPRVRVGVGGAGHGRPHYMYMYYYK